jgi:hypothetical protein
MRATIKVPTVMITLMSTVVSPTTSICLSTDIPHVYIISAISLPFISLWVILRSSAHIFPVIISPGRPKTVPVFFESLIFNEVLMGLVYFGKSYKLVLAALWVRNAT